MKRFIDEVKARELVEDHKMQAKMKKKVLDICIKFGYAELDWVDYFINEYVELVKKQIENKIDVIKEKEVIEWLEI